MDDKAVEWVLKNHLEIVTTGEWKTLLGFIQASDIIPEPVRISASIQTVEQTFRHLGQDSGADAWPEDEQISRICAVLQYERKHLLDKSKCWHYLGLYFPGRSSNVCKQRWIHLSDTHPKIIEKIHDLLNDAIQRHVRLRTGKLIYLADELNVRSMVLQHFVDEMLHVFEGRINGAVEEDSTGDVEDMED